MYSYTEKKFPKRRLIVSLSCLLIAAAAFLTYEYSMKNPAKDTSVLRKTPRRCVLSLPAQLRKKKHPAVCGQGRVVLDYFDGKDSKVDSMTKFEGVYRANQGIIIPSTKGFRCSGKLQRRGE